MHASLRHCPAAAAARAVTIARIVSGNARARERPEVRAKVEAYSRSRVGVQLSPEHRVSRAAQQQHSSHVASQQLNAVVPAGSNWGLLQWMLTCHCTCQPSARLLPA